MGELAILTIQYVLSVFYFELETFMLINWFPAMLKNFCTARRIYRPTGIDIFLICFILEDMFACNNMYGIVQNNCSNLRCLLSEQIYTGIYKVLPNAVICSDSTSKLIEAKKHSPLSTSGTLQSVP